MFKSALSMLLFSCFLGHLDCTDIKLLPVKRGENATLQCNGTRGAAVVMLRWKQRDQQSELGNTNKQLYVLFIRENRPYENLQLPSFKGRVQLRDPQMKDGDLSVIIKNISMNDAGLYECYAGYGKDDLRLMSSTNLSVVEPGSGGGTTEDGGKEDARKEDGGKEDGGKEDGGEKSDSVCLKVGLSVAAVFAVIVCCIIFRKRLNKLISNCRRPADFEMVPVRPAAVPGSQQSVQHSQ